MMAALSMSQFKLSLAAKTTSHLLSEVILRARLSGDPEIVTSLRYLARDKTNSMNQLVTVVCTKLGFIERGQPFDPDTKLAKTVFVIAQLGYTLVRKSRSFLAFWRRIYYSRCCNRR